MELALFQPDIPQNLGSALRLSACLSLRLHVIEPCGFIFDDKRIRRAGMDYMDLTPLQRHACWDDFLAWRGGISPRPRLVLLTTKSDVPLLDFSFRPDDILLLGRESAGVPAGVAETADVHIRIPMQRGARSLNVVISAAMALTEGLRQTSGFPQDGLAVEG